MSKISIIIPNYNNAATLKRCLDSVLAQTYNDFEIIVVDDGSTDNSREILDEYARKDDRFTLVFKKNAGVSSARNTGLRLARGEFVQFIDADDSVSSDMLEKLLQTAEATKADMVVFRFTHDCWKAFLPQGVYYFNKLKDGFKLYSDFFAFELPWNKFIRRSAIRAEYDESVKIFEGSLFYLANHKGIKKVAVIEDELYHYYNAGACDSTSCVNGFLKSKFWEAKTGYWYKLHELEPLFKKALRGVYDFIGRFMSVRTFDMAFIELIKLIDAKVPDFAVAAEMHNIFNETAFQKSVKIFGKDMSSRIPLSMCQEFVRDCRRYYDGCKSSDEKRPEAYYQFIDYFFCMISTAKAGVFTNESSEAEAFINEFSTFDSLMEKIFSFGISDPELDLSGDGI